MEDDTEISGGEELTLDEAANAYAKTLTNEADQGHPEESDIESEEADDDLEMSADDEEDDSETEDDETSDDEEGDEPESEGGRFVADNAKVKLSDGTVLTVAELRSGHLMDKDYRQKTMSLAEERRAFEAKSSDFEASQKQVQAQQEYLAALMESISPKPPSMSMLDRNSADYDPDGYTVQKAQFDEWQKHVEYIKGDLANKQQQNTQQSEQERIKLAGQEWEKLTGIMPELKEEAKLSAFTGKVKKHATEAYGFTPQELADFLPFDHRYSMVMSDAIKWRELQASKANVKKKVENKPPVQKAGKRMNSADRRAIRSNDAMNRLKETGSVDDAVKAFLASKG